MTEIQKATLWNALHECYSISSVIAHSCDYLDGKTPSIVTASSYATLLERAVDLLSQSISIVDNLKIDEEVKSHD